jgi:predicted Zn-dependent protease
MKLVFLFAFAGLLFVSGCKTTAPDAKPMSKNEGLDENIERRLWNRSEEESSKLERSGFLYEDKELENYVNAVARKIDGNSKTGPTITVKVIKSPIVNAFAYPTGRIYVHTAMLAALENEAQFAAVLGHEMAHVYNRHAAQKWTKQKIRSESKVNLNSWLGSFGESMGQIAIEVSVNGYSREAEMEADQEGLARAVRAGYDPSEAAKWQAFVKEASDREKKKLPRTHPRIDDRIKSYEALLAGEYQGKRGITNSEAFQRRTTALLLDNAVLDLKLGHSEVAERSVKKYMRWKPDDARAYFLLGESIRENGQPDAEREALTSYQKAISLRRNYPEPYRSLGMVALKKGEKQEAKKNFEVYLSLRPDAEDRDYIRQYINDCR